MPEADNRPNNTPAPKVVHAYGLFYPKSNSFWQAEPSYEDAMAVNFKRQQRGLVALDIRPVLITEA